MKYKSFHYWLIDNLKEGSNVLEFGSGEGTKLLTEKFNVTSIEHDIDYVGLDPKSKYIHAEFINGWYDVSKLQGLNKPFDAIIIDGPNGHLGRHNLLNNLNLFNFNTIIIVDDINRKPEMNIFKELIKDKNYSLFMGEDRFFGVIYKL